MYEIRGNSPALDSCKEPDWEMEIKQEREKRDVIAQFQSQLLNFINVVGGGRHIDGHNFLAELVGTVAIDLMQREQRIERLMKKLESK